VEDDNSPSELDIDPETHPSYTGISSSTRLSAKQRFDQLIDERAFKDTAPLERLRFFCSLALDGQDWLDVESFFDAVAASATPALTKEQARRKWHLQIGCKTWESCPTERECRAFDAGFDAARSAMKPRDKKDQAAADILLMLVALKLYKDLKGKDEHYEEKQPEAWAMAKAYLQAAMPKEYSEIVAAMASTDGTATEKS
jgi:hypothetical protein